MTTKIKNNIVDVPENSDMLAEATKEVLSASNSGQMGM